MPTTFSNIVGTGEDLANSCERTDIQQIFRLILHSAAPGPVSNIVWTRQTDTTAVVSWGPPERPNGIITEYIIILTEYQGGVILVETVGGNATSFDISHNSPGKCNDLNCEACSLIPREISLEMNDHIVFAEAAGTPYTATIRAENAAGDGHIDSINEFTRELCKCSLSPTSRKC